MESGLGASLLLELDRSEKMVGGEGSMQRHRRGGAERKRELVAVGGFYQDQSEC